MKHNLMIVCNNYEFSKIVANNLAEYFSMRVFDEIAQLEFDFNPITPSELLSQFGKEFVFSKLSKIALSQCEFEEIIFLTHFDTIKNISNNFDTIKENDFVIVINVKNYKNSNKNNNFENIFCDEVDEMLLENIKNNLADCNLEIADENDNEVTEQIINAINKFYNI